MAVYIWKTNSLTLENGKTYASQRNYGVSFSGLKNISLSKNRNQVISQFGKSEKNAPGIILIVMFFGIGIFIIVKPTEVMAQLETMFNG
ncbi:MAG: hypothetical protein ACE5F2_00040 [Candidatus Paceibacteria bacterium]